MTMTYGQIRDALSAALTAALDDDDSYCWVADFTDTYVVYEVNHGEYFQDDYTLDDEGNVTLKGSPDPVKPVTTYTPTEADATSQTGMTRRGMHPLSGTWQMLSRLNPWTPLAAELRGIEPRIKVRSESLTYERHGEHSYFADRVLRETRGDLPASRRLERHRVEMDVELPKREARLRAASPGNFEYRTNPSTSSTFAPPLWVIEDFGIYPRATRVLAALAPNFHLPEGVEQVSIPRATTGNIEQPTADVAPVPSQDLADTSHSSNVVTIAGSSVAAIQLLEQSPPTAAFDHVTFMDLAEAYDAQFEAQLLNGAGSAVKQLTGVLQIPSVQVITYTDGSPTGHAMYPFFGQASAKIGNNRKRPHECWLMNTSRWAWLSTQEDSQNRPLVTPDPATPGTGNLIGFPVFLDDAVPTNLGAGANQDTVVALRPSDMLVWESDPKTLIDQESSSGTLQVRIRLHAYCAAIVGRQPNGIAAVEGTGMVVQSGFNA